MLKRLHFINSIRSRWGGPKKRDRTRKQRNDLPLDVQSVLFNILCSQNIHTHTPIIIDDLWDTNCRQYLRLVATPSKPNYAQSYSFHRLPPFVSSSMRNAKSRRKTSKNDRWRTRKHTDVNIFIVWKIKEHLRLFRFNTQVTLCHFSTSYLLNQSSVLRVHDANR